MAHISGFITCGVGEWRHDSLATLVTLKASFLFFFFSSSKGDVSFVENASKALKQLFFAGLHRLACMPVLHPGELSSILPIYAGHTLFRRR